MATGYDYDLLVLGGGAAGLTAAAGAAQLGVKVLLVEREDRLGGDCLHYGCVPSKTLLATAHARHMLSRAGEFGLPAVDALPVDFAAVRRRIEGVIAGIQAHDSPERFTRLGADVRFGRAAFVSDHEIELDGQRISAARVLIATGSRAAVPDVPGLAEAGFLTNREIFSLPALPESLAILGGGAIAAEMAQAFARLGSRVTVIQRSPRLLTREDPDLAAVVADRLAAEGVDLRLGSRLVSVAAGPGGTKEIAFERDGRRETVAAAHLLVALGRTANLDDLRLDAAGVARTQKGLALDERLRTSRPHIFGAGDVTGEHLFTHAAGYEGGVVVANAVFRLPRKVDYRHLPRCVFTEPQMAVIGRTEAEAKAAGELTDVVVEPFSGNDRARAEGETLGFCKLVRGRRGRLIGVGIVGPAAGDLAGAFAVALAGKVGLSTIAGAVQPYPTLAEIGKRAAGRPLEPKLFSPFVRRVLRTLYGYRGRGPRD
jgi:pyruvate/2-oxoglutarate dehydrogenase complex dihydrolipoamide dehydrogenase (E3) component